VKLAFISSAKLKAKQLLEFLTTIDGNIAFIFLIKGLFTVDLTVTGRFIMAPLYTRSNEKNYVFVLLSRLKTVAADKGNIVSVTLLNILYAKPKCRCKRK